MNNIGLILEGLKDERINEAVFRTIGSALR